MSVVRVILFVLVGLTTHSVSQRMTLEHWMRDLPPELKNIPLIYLAIPGSHDSMTYGITQSSALAPDADPGFHILYPLFRDAIMRWTRTQSLDVMGQLRMGIRYLDLRVATKTGSDLLYFTHTLYAGEISEPLQQVKRFVESHEGEVVILDFQHFYGFTAEDHSRLVRLLLYLFRPLLVQRSYDFTTITLNSLRRLNQRIIIVYRYQEAVFDRLEFWQSSNLTSPWPRAENTTALQQFLRGVKRSPGDGFFVHQAVITPTTSFVISSFLSSLKDKCAIPVLKDVLPKIATDFSPGAPSPGEQATVNIVIADFIELQDSLFPKTIINLNRKLLTHTATNYG